MSNIRMLDKKEEGEADVEVTWADQQQINTFSKLTNQIDDLREEKQKMEQEKEYLDDAAMELELVDEDDLVRHKVGDTFVHIAASDALEKVEKAKESLGLKLESIDSEVNAIQEQMEDLKKSLYSKFGTAINLEKD